MYFFQRESLQPVHFIASQLSFQKTKKPLIIFESDITTSACLTYLALIWMISVKLI